MKSIRTLLVFALAGAGCSTPNNPVDGGADVSTTDTTTSGDALFVQDTVVPTDVGDVTHTSDVATTTDVPVPGDATSTDVVMVADVPSNPDASRPCALESDASWSEDGGRVAVRYSSGVMPVRGYTRSRVSAGTTTMCSPPLPDCGAAGITVGQLAAAMAHPAVVRALGESPAPLFGIDTRPTDGSVFVLTRSDGSGFTVGSPCAGASGCRDIPGGIDALVSLLHDLDTQQIALPECATVR